MAVQVLSIPYFQARTNALLQAREPKFTPFSVSVPKYVEFYCQSTGSNLNSGSDNNATAVYTATNGNWDGTSVYTPTDGSNPFTSGVAVGMFASVYIDAATVGVYIARIVSVVNAVNGAITLSTLSSAGTSPVSSATARSIKVGGAWRGPNGASGFPFILNNVQSLTDASSRYPRINLKNDATYSVTASINLGSVSSTIYFVQGYTVTPGDGGKATIDGGTSTATIFNNIGQNCTWIDIIFSTSFASGSSHLNVAAGIFTAIRCVFKGARACGVFPAAGTCCVECEFYNCNASNTATISAINLNAGTMIRCVIHGMQSGANCDGIRIASGPCVIQNCVIASNQGNGITIASTSHNGLILITNNDLYSNGGDGINIVAGQVNPFWLENNNFVRNGGSGINNQITVANDAVGFAYNNGFVDNHGPNMIRANIVENGSVFYPSGSTPWRDPDNGDFSVVLPQAIGAGRGVFTETQGYTNPNTVGYPSLGAAAALAQIQSFNLPGTTQVLSAGYINHNYNWTFAFNATSPVTVALQSGTIPPGLSLVTLSPQSVQLVGIPTTLGVYTFTLRATIGTVYGDSTFQLTINNDPDEGFATVGGG